MHNTEQIQNNQSWVRIDYPFHSTTEGVKYRASGNLFMAWRHSPQPQEFVSNGSRGFISQFSASSAKRMRRYLRETTVEYTHMVTLTYPEEFPTDGGKCKEHLRRFLQEVQREYKRTSAFKRDPTSKTSWHSSFWFLEFQKRGAPHFHIFTNWAPSKSWVSLRWYEIVASKEEDHFKAGTRVEKLHGGKQATVSYASKYAAKLIQKIAPVGFDNLGRWWGVYGNRSVVSAECLVTGLAAQTENVKISYRSLISLLKRLVDEGKAKVIKTDEDFFMVDIKLKEHQEMVLRKLYVLQAHCGDVGYMFEDADIDYGSFSTW